MIFHFKICFLTENFRTELFKINLNTENSHGFFARAELLALKEVGDLPNNI